MLPLYKNLVIHTETSQLICFKNQLASILWVWWYFQWKYLSCATHGTHAANLHSFYSSIHLLCWVVYRIWMDKFLGITAIFTRISSFSVFKLSSIKVLETCDVWCMSNFTMLTKMIIVTSGFSNKSFLLLS